MATKSTSQAARKETDRKMYGTLIAIGLVVAGVASYFLIPYLQAWFERVLTGWRGLVYLLGGAFVLEAWFLILGYRGKALLYALGIQFVEDIVEQQQWGGLRVGALQKVELCQFQCDDKRLVLSLTAFAFHQVPT